MSLVNIGQCTMLYMLVILVKFPMEAGNDPPEYVLVAVRSLVGFIVSLVGFKIFSQ